MRDRKRIKPFLEELGDIWEENCPDWRFGQLLVNVINDQPEDPFFWEEGKTLQVFKDYFTVKPNYTEEFKEKVKEKQTNENNE